MYFLGIFVWIVVVVLIARWATARLKYSVLRTLLVVVAVPLSFVLALADEIVGKFQFDRLCEEAKEVKIYGMHPVGEELYTPEGKWRMGLREEDAFHLSRISESIIYVEKVRPFPEEIPAAIPIWKFHEKVYERSTKRLLAEWDQFGTSGGWLSRNFETPFWVRSQCLPALVQQSQLEQRILPFANTLERRK